MATNRNTLFVGAALVAALVGGFGLAKLTDRTPLAETETHEEEHPVQGGVVQLDATKAAAAGVAIVTVSRGSGSDLRLTGRVESAPTARAGVGSPVSGVVERLLAPAGTPVAAGQGLVVLKSPDGAALRAEASAAAADAEAAALMLAREDRLFRSGVTARQDFEAARATSAKAAAQVAAARARLSAAGAPDASGQTVVRSPIAGVVSNLAVTAGGFVAQGAPIAEVADPSRLEVVFSAPAEAAARLKPGALLKVVGPDGREADANIIGIAPLAQGATGAATMRAALRGGNLVPGSAVSASIPMADSGLITVPSEAVQTLESRHVVFVVVPGGFKPVPVTPGRAGGGYTQIVAGLKGDERIAGRGAFLLKAELSKGEAEHED